MRVFPLLTAALLLAAAPATAGDVEATEEMVRAAHNLLERLSPDQRHQAMRDFDDNERLEWHFIPKASRKGLALEHMSADQQHLAHVLLNASLSSIGYAKATTIMSLESILRELENRAGANAFTQLRNPLSYYVTLFGAPTANGAWGWSLEGHHVSVNFTVVDGTVSSTPAFFGANPHRVPEGPAQGLRVLGREEDLGRGLLALLDSEQRKRAILGDQAPRDILTSADRDVSPLEPQGLPAADMSAPQREALRVLVEEYVRNVPAELAARRRAQYESAEPAEVFFAWIGSSEPGEAHYYRVQTPSFLIEYDNVQNDANHSHTVWRDFNGDFGRDLLREHRLAVAH